MGSSACIIGQRKVLTPLRFLEQNQGIGNTVLGNTDHGTSYAYMKNDYVIHVKYNFYFWAACLLNLKDSQFTMFRIL